MSDPTVESITKALQETNHFRLPLDLFCETLLKEVARQRAALDRIAFCGAGEDYRVLREIARKALETHSIETPL